MSRKPSFANLRARAVPEPVAAPPPDTKSPPAPSRAGRKQIAGFFTPEMSLAMHLLARRQDRSLQALMAEAFNDVLRKYGESPVGD
ncbi:ribbon-helix-helix domain-containing protein [Sphingomonas sanguinis]|jgi:hypothetical protein|uniref:Antitoxin-like ribbon-helix-helix domain-containing protein n=1 Tax=Sphingomonas sanguinis TaxID=33051 RepID=A0A7Y7QYG4_9SPHN|nr:ribbon-helix-helix domain-containing protein [Sphingomonas sanguinis]MBZ6383776.1 hypothetical protein [Sphingomonas sanguinis]NNG49697.1 hypothetical protein [Sphingomonas sanguinis]NNG52772.1 hypothetical protein [Sphingomonas sanguinis]NVP33067.1 hypothetical protein [Sphingomonas sanguinis]